MTEQWKAYGYGENNRTKCHVLDAKGNAVASVSGGIYRAHLISAAPDLLEALEEMDSELSEFIDSDAQCDHSVGICWCDYWRRREGMRAAVAKAKGEPNAPHD